MITTRAFHVKHYLDLETEGSVFAGMGRVPETVLYRLADNPHAQTLVSPEGFPILVMGVIPINIGIGEVFILPGKGWVYHTLGVCRILKTELSRFLIYHHRIQATCNTKDEKYGRFLEMFGFEREGVLRHYNKLGEDFYMYSIISGD